MDVFQAVETVTVWAEQKRLIEEAFVQFEQWLQSRGGAVGTFSQADIQAAFQDQSLLFASRQPLAEPVIVTCLALAVYDGECPLGTFKLLTDLHGRRHGIEVELGVEVTLEGLDGHVWRFYE